MTSHHLTSSWRFRAGSVALVVAAAVALSGCNSGGEPDPAVTATTSAAESIPPSATPTPTATYKPADATGRAQNVPVPVLPEVAKTETKEGLEAFTRYWFELLNFAYETGDISGIRGVTSPSCDFCSNITTSLTTNYQGDRWLVGGRVTVPTISSTFERAADENYQVQVQVQQALISYHQAGGSQFRADTQPSDTGNILLVRFDGSAWRVSGLHPLR